MNRLLSAKIKKLNTDELTIVRRELALQKEEKEKLLAELGIAREELAFQLPELRIKGPETTFLDTVTRHGLAEWCGTSGLGDGARS